MTKRITLRRVIASDAAAILQIALDPIAQRFDPGGTKLRTLPEIAAEHAAWVLGVYFPEREKVAAVDLATGDVVGVGRVIYLWDSADLAYSLVPAVRGRGLGTEVVGLLVDRALASAPRRMRALYADIVPANTASIRAAEKNGFVATGNTSPFIGQKVWERK